MNYMINIKIDKKDELLKLIENELLNMCLIKKHHNLKCLVENSIPILWFGNVEKYFISKHKIITVSLNPSDIEFKNEKTSKSSTNLRFPDYNGSVVSIYNAYNNYFRINPYNSWFKSSFQVVLKSFNATHYDIYDGFENIAIHTDICSPFATNPSWSNLSNNEKTILENYGNLSWHNLVKILEPDVILFSASRDSEKKIKFFQLENWIPIDVKAKSPLLKGKFKINDNKVCTILFQIQGRKPFLKTKKEEKISFSKYI